MQSVIILWSWQKSSNSVEWWESWPSSIRSRYPPTFRGCVCNSKCLIQSKPISFVVHPLSLTESLQCFGNLNSSYQDSRMYTPFTTTNGGSDQPSAFTAWITVTHSRLPGCIAFALPDLSELVTTIAVEITPIINPVSSKL